MAITVSLYSTFYFPIDTGMRVCWNMHIGVIFSQMDIYLWKYFNLFFSENILFQFKVKRKYVLFGLGDQYLAQLQLRIIHIIGKGKPLELICILKLLLLRHISFHMSCQNLDSKHLLFMLSGLSSILGNSSSVHADKNKPCSLLPSSMLITYLNNDICIVLHPSLL